MQTQSQCGQPSKGFRIRVVMEEEPGQYRRTLQKLWWYLGRGRPELQRAPFSVLPAEKGSRLFSLSPEPVRMGRGVCASAVPLRPAQPALC